MTNDELNKGTVQLPHSFFAKEKRSYNNWKIAWFREAIQNALDAGAKNIDFQIISDSENDSFRVVCQDDGKGMDEDTLINVFLKMGGSKKSDGSIGGFGYAKVLLAFAHKGYSIETNNILLQGEGGNYTWGSTSSTTKGVRIQVDMLTEDSGVNSMEDALRTIVRNSNLKPNVSITLNNEKLVCTQEPFPYKKSTELGVLSFKDQPHGYSSSNLWVRMNGLAMFKLSMWSNNSSAFEGCIELEGSSLDLLTSNRDSMSQEHGNVLNQILQTLANDRERLKLSGDFDITLNKVDFDLDRFARENERQIVQIAQERNISVDELIEQLMSDQQNEEAAHPFSVLAKKMKDAQSKVEEKINKIPSEWYPNNFPVKYSDEDTSPEGSHAHAGMISSSMSKKRNGKLAVGWNQIINTLLDNETYREALCVCKNEDGSFSHYGNYIQAGFVYGSPMGLNVNDRQSKRISILLNPEKARELLLGDIIDIAHHELTHVYTEYHNESFITKEFELRRIARREIGERALVNAFESAVAEWRGEHSNPSVKTAAQKPSRDDETSYGY